jgi:hypothetical protein
MYLAPELVAPLFYDIAARLPGAMVVFDTVPRWFSRLTLAGLQQTPHYRLPPMPWGIDRDEIGRSLRRWLPREPDLEFLEYRAPRGVQLHAARLVSAMPVLRHEVPCLVKLVL